MSFLRSNSSGARVPDSKLSNLQTGVDELQRSESHPLRLNPEEVLENQLLVDQLCELTPTSSASHMSERESNFDDDRSSLFDSTSSSYSDNQNYMGHHRQESGQSHVDAAEGADDTTNNNEQDNTANNQGNAISTNTTVNEKIMKKKKKSRPPGGAFAWRDGFVYHPPAHLRESWGVTSTGPSSEHQSIVADTTKTNHNNNNFNNPNPNPKQEPKRKTNYEESTTNSESKTTNFVESNDDNTTKTQHRAIVDNNRDVEGNTIIDPETGKLNLNLVREDSGDTNIDYSPIKPKSQTPPTPSMSSLSKSNKLLMLSPLKRKDITIGTTKDHLRTTKDHLRTTKDHLRTTKDQRETTKDHLRTTKDQRGTTKDHPVSESGQHDGGLGGDKQEQNPTGNQDNNNELVSSGSPLSPTVLTSPRRKAKNNKSSTSSKGSKNTDSKKKKANRSNSGSVRRHRNSSDRRHRSSSDHRSSDRRHRSSRSGSRGRLSPKIPDNEDGLASLFRKERVPTRVKPQRSLLSTFVSDVADSLEATNMVMNQNHHHHHQILDNTSEGHHHQPIEYTSVFDKGSDYKNSDQTTGRLVKNGGTIDISNPLSKGGFIRNERPNEQGSHLSSQGSHLSSQGSHLSSSSIIHNGSTVGTTRSPKTSMKTKTTMSGSVRHNLSATISSTGTNARLEEISNNDNNMSENDKKKQFLSHNNNDAAVINVNGYREQRMQSRRRNQVTRHQHPQRSSGKHKRKIMADRPLMSRTYSRKITGHWKMSVNQIISSIIRQCSWLSGNRCLLPLNQELSLYELLIMDEDGEPDDDFPELDSDIPITGIGIKRFVLCARIGVDKTDVVNERRRKGPFGDYNYFFGSEAYQIRYSDGEILSKDHDDNKALVYKTTRSLSEGARQNVHGGGRTWHNDKIHHSRHETEPNVVSKSKQNDDQRSEGKIILNDNVPGVVSGERVVMSTQHNNNLAEANAKSKKIKNAISNATQGNTDAFEKLMKRKDYQALCHVDSIRDTPYDERASIFEVYLVVPEKDKAVVRTDGTGMPTGVLVVEYCIPSPRYF